MIYIFILEANIKMMSKKIPNYYVWVEIRKKLPFAKKRVNQLSC